MKPPIGLGAWWGKPRDVWIDCVNPPGTEHGAVNGHRRDGDSRRDVHRIASQRDGFSTDVAVPVGKPTSRQHIDIASQQILECVLQVQ